MMANHQVNFIRAFFPAARVMHNATARTWTRWGVNLVPVLACMYPRASCVYMIEMYVLECQQYHGFCLEQTVPQQTKS